MHALDVYIPFPNGLKRPDISIFCDEPAEDEQDRALTRIPEAVIEVVSKGFEAKDLEIGPPFYLSQGVKDVVVFDPTTLLVLHVRADGTTRQVSPVAVERECGCTVDVSNAGSSRRHIVERLKTVGLFALTAIIGCYLPYLWLKQGYSA